MNGRVDGHGRALVPISVLLSPTSRPRAFEAWIDTGFNGELALPAILVNELKRTESGTVKATLADGSQAVLKIYECAVEWFGEQRNLQIVASDSDFPLLGVGLLQEHDLHISYRSGAILIE